MLNLSRSVNNKSETLIDLSLSIDSKHQAFSKAFEISRKIPWDSFLLANL